MISNGNISPFFLSRVSHKVCHIFAGHSLVSAQGIAGYKLTYFSANGLLRVITPYITEHPVDFDYSFAVVYHNAVGCFFCKSLISVFAFAQRCSVFSLGQAYGEIIRQPFEQRYFFGSELVFLPAVEL